MINFVIEIFIMTIELEEVISTLNDNIIELKGQYNNIIKENTELKDKLLTLTKQLNIKENENENIINNYESLKMAKTIAASSGDAHDAKIKINRLVREIDKCISLLNK